MKSVKKEIKKKRSELRMLLLKPVHLCNSDRIAKSIAACKWVKEVHITTGEFGFLINRNKNSNTSYDQIRRDLGKMTRGMQVYELTMHSTYRQL